MARRIGLPCAVAQQPGFLARAGINLRYDKTDKEATSKIKSAKIRSIPYFKCWFVWFLGNIAQTIFIRWLRSNFLVCTHATRCGNHNCQ